MLYLVALILPPLAVLFCGKVFQAILNVFLSLLFYFPGAIHALLVVKNHYDEKRTDKVIEAIEKNKD